MGSNCFTARGWRVRLAGASLAALCILLTGCGDDGSDGDSKGGGVAYKQVTSRDGVISLPLSNDLVIHTQDHAVMATSPDGRYRFYVAHFPHDSLARFTGRAKDAFIARGWEIVNERHYQRASEVESKSGFKATARARSSWFVERNGRLVLCEAIVEPSRASALGPSLRRVCQNLGLTYLEQEFVGPPVAE